MVSRKEMLRKKCYGNRSGGTPRRQATGARKSGSGRVGAQPKPRGIDSGNAPTRLRRHVFKCWGNGKKTTRQDTAGLCGGQRALVRTRKLQENPACSFLVQRVAGPAVGAALGLPPDGSGPFQPADISIDTHDLFHVMAPVLCSVRRAYKCSVNLTRPQESTKKPSRNCEGARHVPRRSGSGIRRPELRVLPEAAPRPRELFSSLAGANERNQPRIVSALPAPAGTSFSKLRGDPHLRRHQRAAPLPRR
jgi:hypothetical protein